MQAKR
jgi:hypothetical protein